VALGVALRCPKRQVAHRASPSARTGRTDAGQATSAIACHRQNMGTPRSCTGRIRAAPTQAVAGTRSRRSAGWWKGPGRCSGGSRSPSTTRQSPRGRARRYPACHGDRRHLRSGTDRQADRCRGPDDGGGGAASRDARDGPTLPEASEPRAAGTRAPDFRLHHTHNHAVAPGRLHGRPVIVSFYPVDWSGAVARAYGVRRHQYGTCERALLVLDDEGSSAGATCRP
jgi:hypothetical protein